MSPEVQEQQELQERLDAWHKTQISFLSAAFENATRYSNIFILAGYGTFFGVWNVTRDHLYGRRLPMVSALLVLISANDLRDVSDLCRVPELNVLLRLSQKLLTNPPQTVEDLAARYQEYELGEKAGAKVLLRIWRPMFLITAGSAYIGIGLLVWVLITPVSTCPIPFVCHLRPHGHNSGHTG